MSILIVLGGPVNDDLTPGVWLKSRLDKAIETYVVLRPAYIILTGGDTRKLGKSESHIMKEYLIKNNIPENKIYLESKSINTIQNAEFTYPMIKHLLNNTIIYVLTSEFHCKRSELIFNYFYQKKYNIKMIEAITPISKIELESLQRNEKRIIEKLGF